MSADVAFYLVLVSVVLARMWRGRQEVGALAAAAMLLRLGALAAAVALLVQEHAPWTALLVVAVVFATAGVAASFSSVMMVLSDWSDTDGEKR